MEPGGRKLLPRVQPAGAEREADAEPTRNGTANTDYSTSTGNTVWRSPTEDDAGPKRKRQAVEEPPQRDRLPSLHQIMNNASGSYTLDADKAGPARLIKAGSSSYIHEGPFKYLAPYPSRDFPTSVSGDTRELSFAVVEPELMDTFRRAWYLRHYIRLKRMQGEHWNDHIYFNDCFGIETTLYTWTSRFEPGTLQYPASMLYKHCVWLFFNRTVQMSQPSPAFAQVVDDGLHFLRTMENAVGPAGDRSIFLIPLYLLGLCAFYPNQRRGVWDVLEYLEGGYATEALPHASRSLETVWQMMDTGNLAQTWKWEETQAHEFSMFTGDRSLADLLWDPLNPVTQTVRVRSPDPYDFDASRFRPGAQPQPQTHPPPPPPLPPPAEPVHNQQDGEELTPPDVRSPLRHHSTVSIDASDLRGEGYQENIQGYIDGAGGSRPFLVPPPPPNNGQYNDVIQVLQRKPKAKSNVPPCPVCGKHLKNPSDAQKHELQHTKPFHCHEPGCSRAQGFATENDLQRHRKSVHGASPRIGNKIGYVCAACPEPSDGTPRKWWPRLDNFKAHIRRKHVEKDEEGLIQLSASANRPGDMSHSGPGYMPSSLRWAQGSHYDGNSRRSTIDESANEADHDANDTQESGVRIHHHNENSYHADGSGSPEDEDEGSLSPSGSDQMDISPTGEVPTQEQRDLKR